MSNEDWRTRPPINPLNTYPFEEARDGDQYHLADHDHLEVVVDIGCHVGYFVLSVLDRFPSAKIIGFEGDPLNVMEANAVFKVRGLSDQIDIRPVAVWYHEGKVIYNSALGGLSHVPSPTTVVPDDIEHLVRSTGEQITVPAITLDQALHNIEHVDLLKVDVEGAEFEIFKTVSKETMERVGSIAMELHDWAGSEAREALFDKLGETHDLTQVPAGSGILLADRTEP